MQAASIIGDVALKRIAVEKAAAGDFHAAGLMYFSATRAVEYAVQMCESSEAGQFSSCIISNGKLGWLMKYSQMRDTIEFK